MRADELAASAERLRAALGKLEGAVDRRLAPDQRRVDAKDELSLMLDDRARLAVELEGAQGRNRALVGAAIEASKRVAAARRTVESLLGESADPAIAAAVRA